MKKFQFVVLPMLLLLFLPTFALADGDVSPAGAAGETALATASQADASIPAPAPTRARVLTGTPPVNVNIASAGTLPQGTLFAALNASFSEKERSKQGGGQTPDVFSQVWLLKVRYGLTDNLELASVSAYANMSRHPKGVDGAAHSHVEGYGDHVLGLSYAPFNLHQGDPLALSFGMSALLPTAPQGANHAPGNRAWGGRAHAALGLWLNDAVKFDTELVLNTPFERGNQDVKRGSQYMWNAQMRYVFDNFDLGLESNLVKTESGDVELPGGMQRNLRNGYTEWYVGPSFNVALNASNAWLGVGVFFPLYQDVKGPSKVDDVRFEFKLGFLW